MPALQLGALLFPESAYTIQADNRRERMVARALGLPDSETASATKAAAPPPAPGSVEELVQGFCAAVRVAGESPAAVETKAAPDTRATRRWELFPMRTWLGRVRDGW